ncbi:SWIM zinc finger family protein [Halomicroarcula sp. F13]|uniref:SWIM zinc finger family protein n=1 Tax=Haloarcula rubra TaxID=2487747 RepID=A0AAW4PXX0_9EURY|nr:SWIM zinc finger family protein [Halomicroarcula rubra]MBX0325415.1 SWIM zinc finger family protein [Halomicroarcula rubra]
MSIEEAQIRERCTEAMFERGQNYRTEGRIGRLTRFGDVITADVQGSQSYDVTVDLATTPFEATCTCPYDGPGICKHVVAVLLDVAEQPPDDEREQIERLLQDTDPDALRSFLLDELARNPELRDRLRARLGDEHRSVDDYRADVDQLFDDYTVEYPVVTEAIDFSHFLEQAEQYRSRGRYREAAIIYRALAEGIEANENLIDAAYDHYAKTFQTALDGYVECVQASDLGDDERQEAIAALSERAGDAIGPYAERYREAVETLDSS